MATDDLGLAWRVEKALNSVDAVMHGLHEISTDTTLQHTLWAFSNALESAQPALNEAFALLQKAQEVANG